MKSFPQSWIDHDKKVRPYVWSHRFIDWSESLLLVITLVLGLRIQRFHVIQFVLMDKGLEGFPLWLVYFGLLIGIWGIVTFPLKVASFYIEKNAGLSKQSFFGWMVDYFKGLLVGAILGCIVLGIFYFCVEKFGTDFWLAAATLMAVFSVTLAAIAPVVLVPIFFKLEPLKDLALKQRLLDLCARFGVKVAEVYHLGLGAKTEKGNAAFLGLGKTKRIAIGDTIYNKYSPEEVEAVFAHELGHQVHQDIWRGMAIGISFSYIGFGVATWICTSWVFDWAHTSITLPFGFFVFLIVFSLVQMPLGVLQAIHSRSREKAADRFAAEKVGMPVPLASALERLTFQNQGFFKPNAVLEFFTYSHPAPWRRITILRGA